MEEKMERLYRNRYAYRDNTCFEWQLSKGVSQKRLQKHWEDGLLTDEMLYLMEALSEMTVFSAKHIESFFWLDWMPECFSRIRSADGKNAYRSLIKSMEGYGILVPAKMVCEKNTVGSKVYGLSSGSLQFVKEFYGARKSGLSKNVGKNYNTDFRLGSNMDYGMILSLLSLNQMHLHVLKHFGREYDFYGRVWVNPDLPVNIYCGSNENVLVWALRGGPGVFQQFDNQVKSVWDFMFRSFWDTDKTRLVAIMEDLNYPLDLHQRLSKENRQNLLYTTDQEVFEGTSMTRYIEVTGPKSYRFTD